MEELLLRVAVLGILLAPMAFTDLRSRGVMTDILATGLGIAACFMIYDLAVGNTAAFCTPLLAAYLAAIIIGITAVVMAKKVSVGSSDGYVILIIAFMLPHIGGVPVSIPIMLAGWVLSTAVKMSIPLSRNISDIRHGRKFCTDMVFYYMKRKGEKFCIDKLELFDSGKFVEKDGKPTVVTKDGKDYFVGEDEEGLPVTKVMPLVFFLTVGFAAVATFLLLGGADFINDTYPMMRCHNLG